MRNKCLFALGLVFAMSLTSIVAFAFSFTGEPDVKNDQQQIVVVNPATESEETTSEQTVSAETEDTTATLQSAGSSLSGSMDWDAEDAYMLAKIAMAEAESEDTEGKALVMLVVLNRVWSRRVSRHELQELSSKTDSSVQSATGGMTRSNRMPTVTEHYSLSRLTDGMKAGERLTSRARANPTGTASI